MTLMENIEGDDHQILGVYTHTPSFGTPGLTTKNFRTFIGSILSIRLA